MTKKWVGYAFISPWLVGFLIFTAYAFGSSVYLSFTRYNMVQPPVWVGLANYRTLLFGDPIFRQSILATMRFAAAAIPVGILAGVGLALLLDAKVRGIGIYRTVFFLPSIVPVVAGSIVFMSVLNPTIGLMNRMLRAVFGITGPDWLQDPTWAVVTLVILSLWGVGGSMVIYLAGLKDIPLHLYEAAKIDGASALQRLRHITLPMLSPVIFFNLVMGVIGVLQYFTQAYVFQQAMAGQGGAPDTIHFYALYLFERAWRYTDMGYASAMGWVLFLVTMGITGMLFAGQKRWVYYES